eukprot:PITA_26602
MKGHLLEVELLSLDPGNYDRIQNFLTKYNDLLLQLKGCGIEKSKEESHQVLSIMSKARIGILRLCVYNSFSDTPLVDNTLYRQLVRSLLYITHSKPDLSYAVGAVSRYTQEPHELHWNAANRILRYVQGTITFGIHYATDTALNLLGFTDSDWAEDNIDRKSTSGYSLTLGSGPICWSSKKQAAIALSSAEADYRGVVNITI